MGFFGRKKKQTAAASSPPVVPTTTTPAASKKEPLLEQVPADEPVVVEKGESPAWANIDAVVGTKKIETLSNPEEGDTDLTVPPVYRAKLKVEQIAKDPKGAFLFAAGCCGASQTVKIAAYAAAVVVGAMLLLSGSGGINGPKKNIAFIGNSYFFVNDMPRLMEQVTGGNIFQDSCLHGSGSILNILKTENGMYGKWQTKNAMIGGVEWVNQDNTVSYLYDYGACSVPQLLTGQDNMLSYGNQYGHYVDDGTNPCLMDDDYLDYQASTNYSGTWDYVVIVDQSKRMCFDDARDEAMLGFNYTYGPLIDSLGATPVIVQPHAFWSYNVNMTGLVDVPTFTSMIMEGAQIYKEYMNTKLSGRFQNTRIAPVGNAFLTVWEEDEELWEKLFLEDSIHPSGYGSYLYAMVLHATIYHTMPPKGRVVTDNTMQLFSTARRLYSDEDGMPSRKEALKLWKIARKVTLLGFKPKALKNLEEYEAYEEEAYEAEEDEDEQAADEEYQGEGYEYGEDQDGDAN